MTLDERCSRAPGVITLLPETVYLRGGEGVLSIVINGAAGRVEYINSDVPRLIDARDLFDGEG